MVGLSYPTLRSVACKPLPRLSHGRLALAADRLGDAALLRPARTLSTYLLGDDGEPVSAMMAVYRDHRAPFAGSLTFAPVADLGELTLHCLTRAWVDALLGRVRQWAVGMLEWPAARLDADAAETWRQRWNERFAESGADDWQLGTSLPATPWLARLASLALAERGGSLIGARVVVVGENARATALSMHQAGARVVAVGDAAGGIYGGQGLSEADLAALGRRGAGHGAAIRGDDLPALPCDLLVWADTDRPLGRQEAASLQADVVIEALPGGVAVEADALLAGHGRLVVPDLLSLAAAETVGADHGPLWLMAAYDDVRRHAEREGIDRRLATYTLAANRAAAGHGRRGTQPLG